MKTKFLIILLFAAFSLFSQVIVEEEVSTDTINLFDASTTSAKIIEDSKKSVALTMFSNILLPGLGHKYIGEDKKAFTYFAVEAVALFGTIFSRQYSSKVYGNSRAYAATYAGTRSNRDAGDEYWKNIAIEEYVTIDNYNYIQELNRNPDKKYVKEDDFWEWGSDEAQEKYRDMRKTASNLQVGSSFFLGAMLLNRAISMIDGRISAKRYNESVFSTLTFETRNSIKGNGAGLALVKRF